MKPRPPLEYKRLLGVYKCLMRLVITNQFDVAADSVVLITSIENQKDECRAFGGKTAIWHRVHFVAPDGKHHYFDTLRELDYYFTKLKVDSGVG